MILPTTGDGDIKNKTKHNKTRRREEENNSQEYDLLVPALQTASKGNSLTKLFSFSTPHFIISVQKYY